MNVFVFNSGGSFFIPEEPDAFFAAASDVERRLATSTDYNLRMPGIRKPGRTRNLLSATTTDVYGQFPAHFSGQESLVPAAKNEELRVPTSANEYRQAPTSTDEYRRVPTSTDEYRRVPTSTDEYRQAPASTDTWPRARTKSEAGGMTSPIWPESCPRSRMRAADRLLDPIHPGQGILDDF
jgi:hypothetical protein